MLKIVALNAAVKGDITDDEIESSKEAQEAIAETEYLRAIKLKCNGKSQLCLRILSDLLEVDVLNEVNMSTKLLIIKYNCYKNIAIISEEMFHYESALQNYVRAILLDDADVYILHRFGQLAFKLNVLDLAEYAFENCLARNAKHWSAAEGLLKTLCRKSNISAAYSLATKMFEENPNSKIVQKTFKEICTLFNRNTLLVDISATIEVNNEIFMESNNEDDDPYMLFNSSTMNNVKRDVYNEEEINGTAAKILESMKINKRDWIAIGRFIQNVYTKQWDYINLRFHFEDIFVKESKSTIMDVEKKFEEPHTIVTSKCNLGNTSETDNDNYNNSNGQDITTVIKSHEQNGTEIVNSNNNNNNDDSDSNARSDNCGETKTKPRRRCSDLHFLEQWGWHKSRRYSSRKKTDRDETDSTLNGYLRKLFSKYLLNGFTSKWPFKHISPKNTNELSKCEICSSDFTEEIFHQLTINEFNCFISKLKQKPIDLMHMVYNWLKYISYKWNIKMPSKIKTMYIDIFNIYICHFDVLTWNQLSEQSFETSFRICLLFLELDFAHSDNWRNIYNHLKFNLGNCFLIDNNYEIHLFRLTYLEYLCYNLEKKYESCITCLERMLDILKQMQPGTEMGNVNDISKLTHFPNLSDICLTQSYLEQTRKAFKRQSDIDQIPELFKSKSWPKLIEIITHNIEANIDNYEDELWLKDLNIQIKILLQSLWNQALYESCLIWAEKCYHYIVSYLLIESRIYRQKILVELHNFVLFYIEALILNEDNPLEAFRLKENDLSRLIQNIINILVAYLDVGSGNEKINTYADEVDYKRLWVVLHQLLLRDENDFSNALNTTTDQEDTNDLIPNSFLLLFTAHEFLGKKQLCSKDNGTFLLYILDTVTVNIKAPLYDSCRELLYEYIEQITYCLYKYPQKKARSKHLEEHEAVQIQLTWPRAAQMFDLYRPEKLPEFNSYKLESITLDMEQFLLKVLTIMPKAMDPSQSIHYVMEYIEGHAGLPDEALAFKIPYKMSSIFYLLGDFYFKNRDFTKAVKYYIYDLSIVPTRFDSWAGMALSKASKIETKLNGLNTLDESIWPECEEVLRCFECCINLNRFQTLLWIEYGTFTYTVHSYFSRYLKHDSENLSMERFSHLEEKKNNMLTISFNCFSYASNLQNANTCNSDENETNDEKWLCQYMLGKISEKRKEEPNTYLNHYLKSANYLYENNATYPIKINHSNPTNLSVEALEIFYRTNAAIIKFLEHGKVDKSNGNLFKKVLKHLSSSPFAYNKAKVDDNSLSIIRGTALHNFKPPKANFQNENAQSNDISKGATPIFNNADRRPSQENSITPSTASITSSVKTSESSSDESDSETDGSSEHDNNGLITEVSIDDNRINTIYNIVIQNIEECVTRFPEHYKSMYRLTYHYMHAPPNLRNLEKCQQLLLGQYKTSLGNIINGLFYERKANNIFHGIWRIPSSEIDRPGGFSAHLVKCVHILIQLLRKTNNHKMLIEIGLNLHKVPDIDKRYIADCERKELYELSITYTLQILRSILQKNVENRNDAELVNLLIDIYKIHKKCIKYTNQKELVFTQLLAEAYKFFIKDKINYMPENVSFVDLAIKLCIQEIAAQKNTDNYMYRGDHLVHPPTASSNANISVLRTNYIPGLPFMSKYIPQSVAPSMPSAIPLYNLSNDNSDMSGTIQSALNTGVLTVPDTTLKMFGGFPLLKSDSPEFQNLFQTYYKKLLANKQLTNSLPNNIQVNYTKADEIQHSSTLTQNSSKMHLNNEIFDYSQQAFMIMPSNQFTNLTTTMTTTVGGAVKNTTAMTATIDSLKVQSQLHPTPYSLQKEIQKTSSKVKRLNKKHFKNIKPYESSKTKDLENENITIHNAATTTTAAIATCTTPATTGNIFDLINTYTNINTSANALANLVQMNSFIQKENNQLVVAPVVSVPVSLMQSSNESSKSTVQEQNINLLNTLPPPSASSSSLLGIHNNNTVIQNACVTANVNLTNQPKTLQEKLAEKQKAGQLNEKCTSLPESNDDFVIILD